MLSLNEIKKLVIDLIFLILSFDVIEFELKEPILTDIQEKITKVKDFIEKNNLKLKELKGGNSLYELGKKLT